MAGARPDGEEKTRLAQENRWPASMPLARIVRQAESGYFSP